MPTWLIKVLAQLAISIGIPALLKVVPGLDPVLVQKIIEIIEKAIGAKQEVKAEIAQTIAEHKSMA